MDEATEPTEWKTVAEAAGPLQAAIIAGRLEAAGIPVWVRREAAGDIYGLTVGLAGRTQVMTPASFYEEARALLEHSPEDDEDYEDDEEDEE